MRNALAIGLLFFAACSVDNESASTQAALLVSPDLVISDVFGGGGNAGAFGRLRDGAGYGAGRRLLVGVLRGGALDRAPAPSSADPRMISKKRLS